MTEMNPSASLDNWREYFRRVDSDIFGIIDHAITVAAADFPVEFISRRDRIAELLFSCRVSPCIGCDQLELSISGDEEANHCPKTVENDGVLEGCDWGDFWLGDNYTYGEARALSDKQEEASVNVDEIMRIKDILLNKEHEPTSVLLESLRKLESVSMSVDVLEGTEIGKAVNGLRRHSSDEISKLGKTLFKEWKELVDQWMKTPNEITGAANLSVGEEAKEEEGAFPSPPYDLDFYVHELNEYKLSQLLDYLVGDGSELLHSLDCGDTQCMVNPSMHGESLGGYVSDPLESLESENERKMQSSASRKPKDTNEANVVGRDQQMRREESDDRPVKHSTTDFDEPRRQPKQTREQMVPAIQRKPLVAAEQKPKLAGPQQDELKKALDQEAKFEFTKRKLQESYSANAKRQRKIIILKAIPKRGKAQKLKFKGPPRR